MRPRPRKSDSEHRTKESKTLFPKSSNAKSKRLRIIKDLVLSPDRKKKVLDERHDESRSTNGRYQWVSFYIRERLIPLTSNAAGTYEKDD